MKNILKKFISFILIVILFLGSTLSAFWNNQNIIYENLNSPKEIIKTESELREKYYIKWEIDTPYWKAYLMIEKSKINQYETRAVWFWDLVDIWMAVSSWAKLFWEPSWENAWWAVLDTVALAPLIP